MDRRQAMIIASWVNENLEGCENPTRVGECVRLEGARNGWRWRVGKHRILGRALGDKLVVDVFRVGNRSDACSGPPK
jgi:mRNA interferase RelE/StbE